jgi:carbamoyltransferase
MNILGISAYYHDSAACLVKDGRIIAAAQEERFTRIKHDSSFPSNAISYCLREANITAGNLDNIVFYEKPYLKFDRIINNFLSIVPGGLSAFTEVIPNWLVHRLWLGSEINKRLKTGVQVNFLTHHESHACSAFFPSPFSESAVLTVDGVGEWTTNGLWHAEGNKIRCLNEIKFPHSLGLLYSAFTAFCGFNVNDGEYKLMGLAPYGDPVFCDLILEKLIDLKPDGSYRINQHFFDYRAGRRMTSTAFENLFRRKQRKPEDPVSKSDADMARSIQRVTEEVLLRQARYLKKLTGSPNLCLAGGVALNCVANGRLLREKIFDRIWIQPASGDAGGALGAALGLWYRKKGLPKEEIEGDCQHGSLLGPAYSEIEIEEALISADLSYKKVSDNELVSQTAAELSKGKTAGWFQGRMEFGPRALGSRSILADPGDPLMQSKLNQMIKFREGFRPFAPVVTQEKASHYFDIQETSPYMLLVASVKNAAKSTDRERDLKGGKNGIRSIVSPLPAITHVDGSARIQTVSANQNPLLHRLLLKFEEITGIPVLVNTSFNVKDEPIVCSPHDAIKCFLRTGIDMLVMENFIVYKDQIINRD